MGLSDHNDKGKMRSSILWLIEKHAEHHPIAASRAGPGASTERWLFRPFAQQHRRTLPLITNTRRICREILPLQTV